MNRLIIFLLLFFAFSFLYRSDTSFDQDLGRHIKLGEVIVQTKSVPLTNYFSYTYPDFPFINSHWLFEALIFLGKQAIGLQGLLVLKITIFLLSIFLILKIAPKNQLLLLPTGFIFLHLLRERPELRPEILSFLFTSATIYVLEKYEKSKTRMIFFLPIIQLIWINTHIYFLVGLILQAIYLIHLTYQNFRLHPKGVIDSLLWIVFGLSVLLSFINPSGFRAILNPFFYSTNYGYTIVENQTMFLLESINFRDPNFLFMKLAALISISSIIFAFFKKTLSVKNFLLILCALTLALMNVRSFPYLFFIALVPVLANFQLLKSSLLSRFLLTLTVFALIFESILYLNGDYYKYTDSQAKTGLEFIESGKGAMDFALKNNLPGPIFNNFDIGSYITYRSFPKYPVFVDGRPGEYPKEFFSSVYIPMQTDENLFKTQEEKYGFKTIIFSHTDQTPWGKTFLSSIAKNPGWLLIYFDDFMVVYLKKDIAVAKNIKGIDLDQLNPEIYNFNNHQSYLRMAVFLLNQDKTVRADAFLNKSLEIFPKSPVANSLKAQLLISTGNISNSIILEKYLQNIKNPYFW